MKSAKILALVGSLAVPFIATAQTVVVSDDFESYAFKDDPMGDWKQRVFKFSDAGCATFVTAFPDFTQGPGVFKDFWGLQYYNIGGLNTGSYMSGTNNLLVADQSQDVSDACHQVRVVREVPSSDSSDLGEGKVVDYSFTVDVKPSNDSVANSASAKFSIFLGFYNVADQYRTIKEIFLPVDLTEGTVTLTEAALNLKNYDNILVTAGMYAQADAGDQAVGNFDDMSVSWVENSDAAAAEELAACEDTSTIRFDGEFEGADVTCKTDTYDFPADAESFAGFADGNRDESLYPFFFPDGGQITFDCASNSATETQRVRFKFERAPYPNNNPEFYTDWVECPATGTSEGITRLSEIRVADTTGAQSVDIPIRGFGESYDSFLLYLETAGGPSVTVTNVQVTSNYSGDYGPNGPTPRNTPDAEPIPVLPLGGLLGLISLLGFIGYRRSK